MNKEDYYKISKDYKEDDLLDGIPLGLVLPSSNMSKEQALQYIKEFPHFYHLLPKHYFEDIDIANIAIDQIPNNYKFISDNLKYNKDFIIKVLSDNSSLVEFVPEELLVEQYVLDLTLFAQPYQPHVKIGSNKNDYSDIINTMDDKWTELKASLSSIKHVSIMAIAPTYPPVSIMSGISNGIHPSSSLPDFLKKRPPSDDILRFFPDSIKNNRDIVLKTVSLYGARLQFASSKLRNDKEIVLLALQQDVDYLEYVGNKLLEKIADSDPIDYLTSLLLHNKLDENVPQKENKSKKKI